MNSVCVYLGDDGVVLPDPLVLCLLFDRVCAGELHSFAVAAQNSLAPADVGGLQGEAAAVLTGSHRVVPDVTQRRRAAHPLACSAQFPARGPTHIELWTYSGATAVQGIIKVCVYLCMVRKVLVM